MAVYHILGISDHSASVSLTINMKKFTRNVKLFFYCNICINVIVIAETAILHQ